MFLSGYLHKMFINGFVTSCPEANVTPWDFSILFYDVSAGDVTLQDILTTQFLLVTRLSRLLKHQLCVLFIITLRAMLNLHYTNIDGLLLFNRRCSMKQMRFFYKIILKIVSEKLVLLGGILYELDIFRWNSIKKVYFFLFGQFLG